MDRSLVLGSGAVALAAVTAGVAALVVLHALPTGLSPARNAVSQYGITRFRLGYRVQTLAYALAGVALAAGLLALPRVPAVVVALCLVFAAARAVISWFPMDAPGAELTPTGRVHGVLAAVTFGSLTAAALRFARQVRADRLLTVVTTASTVLGALMLLCLLVLVATRRTGAGRQYFGAIERVFYLLMTGWLVLVAVALLQRVH